jgi:hypothetical protein
LRPLVPLLATLWLLGPGPTPAAAQDINPDRPDLTTSAELVPAGSLQLETGIEYERARTGGQPTGQLLSTQAVLRAGILRVLELSIEGEPFDWQRTDREASGSGDYTLGVKYRLFTPSEGSTAPIVSVKPFVKLPTASAPIGSERPDVGALLLVTFALPKDLTLDTNWGVAALGQRHPEGFIPQGIASASLTTPVTDRLSAITELFFATKEERDSRASLRTTLAIMYKVTPRLALDGGVRTTLVGPGPDWSVFVGLSARFGR